MAKRAKDLGDWKIVTDEDHDILSGPSTPTRRTRRGTSESGTGRIKLLRTSDDVVVEKGLCVLVSGQPKFIDIEGESYHAVVVDISMGIHRHVEMYVAPLVRPPKRVIRQKARGKDEEGENEKEEKGKEEEENEQKDNEKDDKGEKVKDDKKDDDKKDDDKIHTTNDDTIDAQKAPQQVQRAENDTETIEFHANELLLTAEVNDVLLKNVVDTVKVLSTEKFAEVAIDASLESSVFLCCRATDRFVEKISPKFDFSDWLAVLHTSYSQAIELVAEKTLVIVSPNKSKRRGTRPPVARSRPLARSLVPAARPKYVSGSDLDSELDSDDDSELDSDVDSENSEPGQNSGTGAGTGQNSVPRKRGRPPKATPAGLPRKRKLGSGPATPLKLPKKPSVREGGAFLQAMSVLSPHNRGFKIKSGTSLASLPSFSRMSSDTGTSSGQMGQVGQGDPNETTSDATSEAFRQLREKLHTSTRVPLLPCREEQFEYVYSNLEAAVMEKSGCCIYLSGTPGVGKTATVREAIRKLREGVNDNYVDDFDFLEINCLNLLSPTHAYEKLYEHVSGIKVTPANAALFLEEYFARTQAQTPDGALDGSLMAHDPPRRPLIVLLDELDQLVTRNQKVLYNFFNWPTYPHSQLVVLAVANTMDLPERVLSNKIASRLGLRRYAFRGYTEAELGLIIEHRLAMLTLANKRQVHISQDAMRFASKKVSLVSGDARRALAICRRAVEIAEIEYLETVPAVLELPEHKQAYTVRIAHIGKAIAETVNSPVAQVLEGLAFAAKLVLVGVLLRVRRGGVADVALGDVLDEIRNSLQLLTTQGNAHVLRALADDTSATGTSYVSLLYGEKQTDGGALRVRPYHMTQIVNELVEQGLLSQQNVRSDRHRLVTLTVSEEEMTPVLKRDPDIAAML